MPTINSCCNITNQHNCVGADDFRPRILHKLIYIHFVGSFMAVRYRQYPMQSFNRYNLLLYHRVLLQLNFYTSRISAFYFYSKSKRLQKKSKQCPQRQASLKSTSLCAMLRKSAEMRAHSARLFLACHQSNIFMQQFAAQNRCVPAFTGLRPEAPQRHAAV